MLYVQYANIFSMLSSVLWPSDQPEGVEDYDFVYRLNMSDEDYPSPLLLPAGGEAPLDIQLDQSQSEKSFPLYDDINHKPSREECMRKLQASK